jgi:hypothetical protein
MSPTVWLSALGLYVLFRAWYDNWRGPIRPSEIDRLIAAAQEGPTAGANDLSIVRKFLEEDDGREFVMCNLVKVADGMIPHPTTGVPTPGRDLMQVYSKAFMPALFARGGHPAIVARKVGGYVDAWHVEPDPGWTVLGYMRYRSRRDMMELVADKRFHEVHPFKIAGTAETFSFPTQPMLMMFVGPRLWVGLVIALAAALTQIALLA